MLPDVRTVENSVSMAAAELAESTPAATARACCRLSARDLSVTGA
jgi:hypothetical protein